MNIFEFLRTTFKFIIAFISQDVLIYLSLTGVLIMLIWSLLSLIFNPELKFINDCNIIINYIKRNNLDKENYAEFTSYWTRFPSIMRRGWKAYERKLTGIPSDYLKQEECLDYGVNGGIQKQNRSLMKTIINVFFIITALVSVAIIGTAQGGETEVELTSTVLAESLLVPLFTLLLMKLVYYIYTAIRHHEYKITVETFHDFVDVLDERVDLAAVFAGSEETLALVSNIYYNETIERLRELDRIKYKDAAKRNKGVDQSAVEEKKTGKGLKPAITDTISEKPIRAKRDLNYEVKQMINATLEEPGKAGEVKTKEKQAAKEHPNKKFVIKNNGDFISAMQEVEGLMEEQETGVAGAERKVVEKRIQELITAMTEYRNNSKKK